MALDRPRAFSAPPPVRSSGGQVAQHDRLMTYSTLMLWAISGGAIDISGAADGSDTVSELFVDTYPDEDLLGGDTVTWATSDAVFAGLIAAKINEKTSEHHYWATDDGSDHVLIWPKNPWLEDDGTITVTDTSFTATIANMNSEQAFATGSRVLSNESSGIPDTKMYAIGFDHEVFPSDMGAVMGYAAGSDNRIELDGRVPTRYDLRTISARLMQFAADQITTWYDIGGGNFALAADTERDRHVYQWREWPIFMQAAAAATPEYEVLSY